MFKHVVFEPKKQPSVSFTLAGSRGGARPRAFFSIRSAGAEARDAAQRSPHSAHRTALVMHRNIKYQDDVFHPIPLQFFATLKKQMEK